MNPALQFIDPAADRWTAAPADEAAPAPVAHRVLTLAQWQSVRDTWPADLPVGVTVTNDTDVEDLVGELPRLSLVALQFPKWIDGRAYTQARLLRARYGFRGQVRATGDVVVDMAPLLHRTGFDAAVLRPGQRVESAQRALGFFGAGREAGLGHYQGDVLEPRPRFARSSSTVSALPASALPASALPGAAPTASAIGLYARPSADFDAKLAATLDLLKAAADDHAGRIVQATSLGAEDMVITDLIARFRIGIAIGTLETGKLHAETSALIPRIEDRYGLKVEVYRPREEQVVHFVRRNGEEAMYQSIDLRKECCGIRKLEPLSRMLDGRTAWVTGLRREQSNTRAIVPFVETEANGRTKLNPLADWTWNDVWHYIATHDLPYNPLHDQFMPSIGCAPCTRAIAVGEDFRAGRWWWEDEAAKECGLHVKQQPVAA